VLKHQNGHISVLQIFLKIPKTLELNPPTVGRSNSAVEGEVWVEATTMEELPRP